MPLTHKTPPAPARAIHQTEVQTAADTWAERLQEYIDTLLWRLWYPRTVWRGGTGQAVSGSIAQARLNPGEQAIGPPSDHYSIGSGPTYTTVTISSKAVLLAFNLQRRGPHDPTATITRWFDGLARSVQPSTVAQPQPPTEPVAPAGTLTPTTFVQRAHAAGVYSSDLTRWYITKRWREEWQPVTRLWYGQVTSVDVPNKRAQVLLDAFPLSDEQVTAAFGWGWRVWTKTLVGKRVRVMLDSRLGNYVDDIA